MKIAIIGSGNIGSNLSRCWVKSGHEVTIGSRNPASTKVKELIGSIDGPIDAKHPRDACVNADIVVLAVPWGAIDDSLSNFGDLSGKILIDVNNPVDTKKMELIFGGHDAGAEYIARRVPNLRVVKAFNTVASELIGSSKIKGVDVSVPIACDNQDDLKLVMELVRETGLDPINAGPLNKSRLLEALAMLIICFSRGDYGRNIGFKLLR